MDSIYQVDELMARIQTREQMYRSQVGPYKNSPKNHFDETVTDLRRRMFDAQGNDPVSVPAKVLVYNPHNPTSREFYFREGLESPRRKQQRLKYLDDLTVHSVPESLRTSYRDLNEKSSTRYAAFVPLEKLATRGTQKKKYVFDDRPDFLVQLTSPVAQLKGYRFEKSTQKLKK